VKKVEFEAWVKTHKWKWMMDQVCWDKNREILFYTGDVDGKFIRINRSGQLNTGVYRGAMPNIMEAMFRNIFSKKFPTQEDAYRRVVECGGPSYLSTVHL
jgi:hypothetical protein